uniref:YjiS-like domain-containing protein n=1 Tax=uncultured Armatimonadetes bacterium TaxID=157466 RepID=A0A6J4JRZ9_9BACT|nr:hypothetical protein AVDCRST_MAG63-3975 [uncultured Armatimonadetes bacterium]
MDGDPTLHLMTSVPRPAARRKDGRGPVEEALRILSVWIERARQRRCLAGLSDRSLKDIGISRCDALHEARKPFWRR